MNEIFLYFNEYILIPKGVVFHEALEWGHKTAKKLTVSLTDK